MIDVVYYEMFQRVEYFTVHPDIGCFIRVADTTDGVESVILPDSVPFVLVQSLEILGIDDGVFSLGKRYPAERVAVAQPAVIQRQGYEKTCQPVRNRDRDGKLEFNNTVSKAWKSEIISKFEFKMFNTGCLELSLFSFAFLLAFFCRRQKKPPPIIGATCRFDVKIYKIVDGVFDVSLCFTRNKKNLKNFDFCFQLPPDLIDFLEKILPILTAADDI